MHNVLALDFTSALLVSAQDRETLKTSPTISLEYITFSYFFCFIRMSLAF